MHLLLGDFNAEAFSFLHALNEGLDAAGELLGQLVGRDVVSGLSGETLLLGIGLLGCAEDEARLGSDSKRFLDKVLFKD